MKYNPPFNDSGNPDAPYVDADQSLGIEGSVPPGAAFESTQREIVNFITDTTLIADPNNLHQLSESVQQGTVCWGVDIGTTNHIVATLTPRPQQYLAGMSVRVKMTNDITGATDINFNGIGAVNAQQNQAVLPSGVLLSGDVGLWCYDGTAFQLIGGARTAVITPAGPTFLLAPKIFYVNDATGNDSTFDGTTATNTGSGHGPFKTMQRAALEVVKYNKNGWDITVFVADGTYTNTVVWNTVAGAGTTRLIGNATTPGNCQLVCNANPNRQSGFVFQGSSYAIHGFRTACGAGPLGSDTAYCISVGGSGTNLLIDGKMQFGGCPGNTIGVALGATITMGDGTVGGRANFTIEAGADALAFLDSAAGGTMTFFGFPEGVTPIVTILGTVTYSMAFVHALGGYLAEHFQTITGGGFVVGKKYHAELNGIINDPYIPGVNYLPGTIAGTTATGGQYGP